MGESNSGTVIGDDSKWQQYGLLAGVVFVVLSIVAMFVPGAPPARDASIEKISEYFLDNADGIKLAAIFFGFSLFFGIYWLGSLWRVIGRLESGGPRLAFIAVAGFIVAGGIATFGQSMFTLPALREGNLGASEFAYSAVFVSYSFALAVTAAHMFALAALTMRSGFLPKWMGWLALVSGVVCAIATVGAGTEAEAFAIAQFIGYLTWLLWTLLAAVLLYRRKAA